jgi:oligosaccharide:H+ symporter
VDAGDYYHVIRPLLDLCLCSPVKNKCVPRRAGWRPLYWHGLRRRLRVCEAYIDKVSRASGFEFGRARMFGGIGAAIGTFAAGKLYGIDQNMIFWLASGAGVCLLVIVWKMQISAHPQQGLLSGKASPVTLRDAVCC